MGLFSKIFGKNTLPSELFVECNKCGQNVKIESIFVVTDTSTNKEINTGSTTCVCGEIITQTFKEKEIPVYLRKRSKETSKVVSIIMKIDFERRELPTSPVKKLLKESKVEHPENQGDNKWLIYDIIKMGKVYYNAETETYNFQSETFDSIEELANKIELMQ